MLVLKFYLLSNTQGSVMKQLLPPGFCGKEIGAAQLGNPSLDSVILQSVLTVSVMNHV